MNKSKFKNTEELYEAIDELAELLKKEGHGKYGDKLVDLVHNTAWTTGSELLGELNAFLNTISEPVKRDTRKLINECKYFCSNYRRIMGLY